MDSLPDIQACEPDYPFNLTRVGVTGVKKLVKVERGNDERPVVLISNFEVFVDLPSDRKGANLSRNFEAIDEVLEEAINCPSTRLRSFVERSPRGFSSGMNTPLEPR